MGTIKEKVDKILLQKQQKIIPTNIRESVQIFDITGSVSEGIQTIDATASASDILQDKTAYVNNSKVRGTMINRGDMIITPTTTTQELPGGYALSLKVNAVTALIDSNIVPENIIKGVRILGVLGGAEVQATDATATAANILQGKTAYIKDGIATGTMTNVGSQTITPSTSRQYITQGYHNGNGYVEAITAAVDSNIQAHNIKAGVSILGVTGVLDELDTYDATASASTILQGQTAYINGTKVTGTMRSNGTLNYNASTSAQTIPSGYTTGGTVRAVTSSIDENIKATNIKAGVSILGVEGILTSSGIDTSDSTMGSSDLLNGKIGYNADGQIVGSMPNRGNINITPSTSTQNLNYGYYSNITVKPVTREIDSDIVASNIKEGVNILGVEGTLVPLDVVMTSLDIYPIDRDLTYTNLHLSNLTVHKPTSSIDLNIQPQNIKKSVTILGVTGTLEAGQVSYEAGTLTILAGKYIDYNPKKQEGTMDVIEFDNNENCVCSGGNYVYIRCYFSIMQEQELTISFSRGGYSRMLFSVLDSEMASGTSDTTTNVQFDSNTLQSNTVTYNITDAGKHFVDIKIISSTGTDSTSFKPTGINIRQKLISQVYASIDGMNSDLSQAVGTFGFIYDITVNNMVAVYRFDGEGWVEKSLSDYSGTVTPSEYEDLLSKADELNGEVIE